MGKYQKLTAFHAPPERSFGISTFYGGLNLDADELVMTDSDSPNAYNVDTVSGALARCGGYGIARWKNPLDPAIPMYTVEAPAPIQRMFIYRNQAEELASDNVIIQLADSRLYKYYAMPDYGVVAYDQLTFASGTDPLKDITFLANYRYGGEDCAILGGRTAGMYIYKEGQALASAPAGTPWLSKAVIHYERLFGVGDAAYPQRIWFSAPGNPADFSIALDKGGYIDILGDKGNPRNIFSFNDQLYVFWQYGITRITAYAQQSEFTVSDLFTCGSEILPESIAVCGRQIIFATRDGVYSCNGTSVNCISTKIRKLFDGKSITVGGECAVYHQGRYYLSLHLPFEGDNTPGNNAMLEYDTLRSRWRLFRGCTIVHMVITHDAEDEKLLLACTSDIRLLWWDGSESFGGRSINARWDSPLSDLGAPNSIKELKELHVTLSGSGDLRFILRADGAEQTRVVALTENRRTVKLNYSLRGKLISLTIENTNGTAFLTACPLIIYTLERI